MRKSINLPRERPAEVAAHVGDALPAAARDDERERPALDLQVLEVVVVAGNVEVEPTRLEDRAPLRLQDAVVPVRAVGEERVVGARQLPPRLRLRELLGDPPLLLGPLLPAQPRQAAL